MNVDHLARQNATVAALGAWQFLKKPSSPKNFAEHLLTLLREQ